MFELTESISLLEPAEMERVAAFVKTILAEKPRPTKLPPRRKNTNPQRLRAKLLAAPVWTEEEVQEMEAAIRELRANWKPELQW